jgi:hypothetical protein
MRPVSARFLPAVSGSARVTTRARVVDAGLTGVTLDDGDVLATLDVVDGTVTLDSTAAVRGTLDLTTTAAFWPANATSPLTPYGHEIMVETGVVYGDGSREFVGQGFYRINSVEQQDAPLGTVAVTGSDRMQGIIDARIPYPLSFPASQNVTSVIESLVSDVYPWAVYDFDDGLTGVTLASAQVTTDDRSGFLSTLVTSYGMICYFDYRGILVVKPPPDPDAIVATISSGPGGVLTSLSRTLARDSVYNAVVASGEQLDDTIPPVSAIVVDDDPASPTYYNGDFGHVPQFFTSSFLTTPTQCVSAATSLLQQSTGLPYNVDFGQASNFALEPLDPIALRYPGRREQHVLSQLVIPLNATTAQTAQTRQLVRGTFS